MFAEFGPNSKREIDMPFLPAAHKSDRPGFPDLRTHPDAAAAKNTFLIPEGITDLFHSAASGHILDSPGIGSLGYQQFSQIAA